MARTKTETPSVLQASGGLLTIPEVAEDLNVTERRVRYLVFHRLLDKVKIGKSVRITRASVERIVNEGFEPARKSTDDPLFVHPRSL